MPASKSSIWSDLSNELALVIQAASESVVALVPKHGHAASGVIWQSNVIVAANHSVAGDEVTAVFPGGKSNPVALKGRDPSTDLAIFTTDGTQGRPAVLGDAGNLQVGNLVLAVARTRRGNVTASSGIISGLVNEWQTWQGGQIDRFIRPDLMLYRGYSGGPLVNSKAEVVGINTTGFRRGTPITIPASTVTRVSNEMLAKGHIARPFLGIALQPVSLPENLVATLHLQSARGLLVVHLVDDGPASRAGVMLGDIVTELGGTIVAELPRIHNLMANHRVGERLELTVVRSGERRQLSVTLEDGGAQ